MVPIWPNDGEQKFQLGAEGNEWSALTRLTLLNANGKGRVISKRHYSLHALLPYHIYSEQDRKPTPASCSSVFNRTSRGRTAIQLVTLCPDPDTSLSTLGFETPPHLNRHIIQVSAMLVLFSYVNESRNVSECMPISSRSSILCREATSRGSRASEDDQIMLTSHRHDAIACGHTVSLYTHYMYEIYIKKGRATWIEDQKVKPPLKQATRWL